MTNFLRYLFDAEVVEPFRQRPCKDGRRGEIVGCHWAKFRIVEHRFRWYSTAYLRLRLRRLTSQRGPVSE